MIRITALSAMLALCAITAAQAAPRQIAVSLAGLDLANPADASQLEARIHAAAVTVCGPIDYPLGITGSSVIEARDRNAGCIRQAVQRASARIEAARHMAAIAAAQRVAGN